MKNEYTQVETPSRSAFPMATAGYPFIGAFAFATAVFALLGWALAAFLGLVLSFFTAWFFRDPDRVIPSREKVFVSPADGRVLSVDTIENSPFFEGTCRKISIFMSIFNVHVNRVPYSGRIRRTAYHPGRFFSANLDKASLENEHNAVFLETEGGRNMTVVQIAGLVARRIICRVQENDAVRRGQRFGMICFGSRLDVYLPPDVVVTAAKGDRVKAGTSILGEFPS